MRGCTFEETAVSSNDPLKRDECADAPSSSLLFGGQQLIPSVSASVDLAHAKVAIPDGEDKGKE